MQIRILGLMNVQFTTSDGKEIKGTNIFGGFKDSNVQGMKTQKFFVNEDVKFPEQMKINDILDISFDYRGKIESITKA